MRLETTLLGFRTCLDSRDHSRQAVSAAHGTLNTASPQISYQILLSVPEMLLATLDLGVGGSQPARMCSLE